jgi:hypothetical protein
MVTAGADVFPEWPPCQKTRLGVSLGNTKPFAVASATAVELKQRRLKPWPGRAPLLFPKLRRIAVSGKCVPGGLHAKPTMLLAPVPEL